MNIIRKFKNLMFYADTIKKHEKELYDKYNIKVDNIYRLYTVYNMDEDEYNQYGGDDHIDVNNHNTIEGLLQTASGSGKITNGNDLFNKKIDLELRKLDTFLIKIGLAEMYGYSQKKRIDKLNYKVVIEYKFLSTKFLANLAVIVGLVSLSSIIIGSIVGLILLLL